MRIRKKLFEIRIYEYDFMDEHFFRAEAKGISASGSSVRIAINDLLKEIKIWEGKNG